MSAELIAFLRARFDEDELWATEASRRQGGPAPEGGVHWRWEDLEADEVLTVDPGRDEYVGGQAFSASLRSREQWPTTSGVGDLPQFAISTAEEVPSAVGGHIVRHDPARILREVEAKREIVRQADLYLCDSGPGCGYRTKHGHSVLRLLALPYDDHPDYREEWRP